MAIHIESYIHAGMVEPSRRRYVVSDAHTHKTLRRGDVVVMSETPKLGNILIREPDMTLHSVTGENDQYVHLIECSAHPLCISRAPWHPI